VKKTKGKVIKGETQGGNEGEYSPPMAKGTSEKNKGKTLGGK
jgi:hypothetical protein